MPRYSAYSYPYPQLLSVSKQSLGIMALFMFMWRTSQWQYTTPTLCPPYPPLSIFTGNLSDWDKL